MDSCLLILLLRQSIGGFCGKCSPQLVGSTTQLSASHVAEDGPGDVTGTFIR